MKRFVFLFSLVASTGCLSSCSGVMVSECSAYIGVGALAGTAIAVLGTNEVLGDSISTAGRVAVGAGGALAGGTVGYALCARAYRQRQDLDARFEEVEADLAVAEPEPSEGAALDAPPVVQEPPAVLQDQIVHLQLNIRFDPGSNRIESRARSYLDALAASLLEGAPSDVIFVGHTDDRGDEETNRTLSERRAQVVADYVAGRGVPAYRVHAEGKGEAEPVASNQTEEGRARNRRVEVFIVQRS